MDFETYFEIVKGIHNITPTFKYINSSEDKSYVEGSCLYDNTRFKAKLILPDELHGDTDYQGQDIAISLTIKLNNQIHEYLQRYKLA